MKRIFSVLIAVIIIFCSVPLAFAAGEPSIELSTVYCSAGDTVTMELSIKNNPGITALYLDLRFDEAFVLNKVTDKKLFGGAMFSDDLSGTGCCLSWDESDKTKSNTADGVIAELEFSVSENIENNNYYVHLSYNQDEIYNSELKNVGVSLVDGKFIVSDSFAFEGSDNARIADGCLMFSQGTAVSEILDMTADGRMTDENGNPVTDGNIKTGYKFTGNGKKTYPCLCFGDVDGDSVVSAADARLALRNAVGLEAFTSLQLTAADTDFSDSVDSADARNILRCSVGLENASVWLGSVELLYEKYDALKLSSDLDERISQAGEYVKNRIKNFESHLDVACYNIPIDYIRDFVNEYIRYEPSFFYVSDRISYNGNGDIITTVDVTFLKDAKKKAVEYNAEIEKLTALKDPLWTDTETALFYHDYICKNFRYDTDYGIYDSYTMLKEKKGVCQAYSLLYKELLQRSGIAVEIVSSESMNHAWNLIFIDGKWYHVDVTWDDPLADRFGGAYHNYFLLSDAAVKSEGHYGWHTPLKDIACSSTDFDRAVWREVVSPYAYSDGKWYYLDYGNSGEALFATVSPEKKGTAVWNLQEEFDAAGGLYSDIYYSGLGVYNGLIIYSTADAVMGYAPSVNASTVLYRYDTHFTKKQICGINVSDAVYYYIASPQDISGGKVYKLEIKPKGDVNGDKLINAKDYTVLFRYTLNFPVNINIEAADYNYDGKVNETDATALRKYIVNN